MESGKEKRKVSERATRGHKREPTKPTSAKTVMLGFCGMRKRGLARLELRTTGILAHGVEIGVLLCRGESQYNDAKSSKKVKLTDVVGRREKWGIASD